MAEANADTYNSRLKRIEDAINLRKPDRVPVAPKEYGVY
jgi:hypothetical protein